MGRTALVGLRRRLRWLGSRSSVSRAHRRAGLGPAASTTPRVARPTSYSAKTQTRDASGDSFGVRNRFGGSARRVARERTSAACPWSTRTQGFLLALNQSGPLQAVDTRPRKRDVQPEGGRVVSEPDQSHSDHVKTQESIREEPEDPGPRPERDATCTVHDRRNLRG